MLAARNPRLVVLRVTGFGQDGPYASRPGFATMAEAMSGFAAINGEPDGPPLLPPIALTDEVAAIAGAFAVMVAFRDRDRTGLGQVIDVNLLESMLQMMSALPSAAAHLGYEQPRLGSGIPYSVPRGTYRCADNRWVAISTSAESVAHRVLALLGLGDDERFATFESRAEHREELDAAVTTWVGHRPSAEVLAAFEEAEAAIAPVYTMREVLADPHVRARAVFVEVDGVVMQGPGRPAAADARGDALGRPRARRRHRSRRWTSSSTSTRSTISPPTRDRAAAVPDAAHRPVQPRRIRDRRSVTRHPSPSSRDRRTIRPERIVPTWIVAVSGAGVVTVDSSRDGSRHPGTGQRASPGPTIRSGSTHACHPLSHPLPDRCRTATTRFVAFHAECAALLQPATELDAAQQALAVELAEVRTQLAELRVVMWPRVDPKDIVHGFRRTRARRAAADPAGRAERASGPAASSCARRCCESWPAASGR